MPKEALACWFSLGCKDIHTTVSLCRDEKHQVATGGLVRFIASNLQRLSYQQSDDVSLREPLCILCGTVLNSSGTCALPTHRRMGENVDGGTNLNRQI